MVCSTEIQAPDGYLLSEDNTKFVFLEPNQTGENTVEVIFENAKKPDLTINKIGSVGKEPLQGAKFSLFYATTQDGAVEKIGDYTTDDNGQIKIPTGTLKDGWYKLQETEAPAGYEIQGTGTYEFFLKAGESKEITVENVAKSGIAIKKVDADTGEPLAGAHFSISIISDGNSSGTNGTTIANVITNSNGVAVVTGLKAGGYVIEETKAPTGYVATEHTETVWLNKDDTSMVTVTFENRKNAGLGVKKMDSITKEPLADATFKITDSKGQAVGTTNGIFRTDEKGFIHIPNLNPGAYVVQEIQAPNGYVLDNTPQTVHIEYGKLHTLEFFNTPKTSILIKKYDSETKQLLEGAKFKVTNVKGQVVGNGNGIFTTNINGTILVPDLKAGSYIVQEANYTKNHFSDIYQGKRLTLFVLNSQKNTGKKRKIFPFAISDFTRVTNLQKNTINVLLVNSNMLISSTMKDNYDQTLFGKFSSPYDALKSTKPIVIIDEPHRFKREDKAYNTLIEKINPLCIFRFGATFPEIKNAKKDYNNLIFNLDSCTSFNQNLIKGVEIDMMPEEERNKSKFKVLDIVNNKETKYCVFKNKQNNKTYELKKDDTLNIMDDNFGSLKIQSIGAEYNGKRIKNAILLSNEQVLIKDDELYSDIYGNIYQDLMLQKAIKNHIDIERENFFRTIKIKTLSLFFIDSISSYRGDDGKGHLRVKFENFLKEELKKELEKYSESNIEIEKQYCSFLQSSIKNISETNGGYFAEDNDKKDEDIAKEVETILRDKQSLVSFKDENGNWNIRRFIFSKWTLREGWDNPNVFQICKLRSSGSEISKLQEVGRGLRLPVDEYGNRISNEQFYLTYLVDYSEKDFANKLVEEINSEIDWKKYCVKPLITKISNGNSNIEKELFKELLIKDYIDIDGNIIIENKDKFFEEYPEFSKGLKNGKVITKDKKEINSVKIRKNKFEEIKQLWDKLNQKYYLSLEDISEEELYEVCLNIFREGIYGENYTTFLRQKVEMKDNKANVITSSSNYYNTFQQKMYYGEFLKQIQKATGIPITIMHKALCEYNKENKLENKFFNKVTLNNFREKFESWFQKIFITRFCYKALNINSFETALTNIKGEVKESIVQGTIGIKKLENFKVPDNFLYDEFIFDSDKEKENIEKSNIEEVVVFGKIPRNSIKIPLYFGGTTSPGFMYVVKKGKDYEINLIIETKDANQNDIRGIEEFKIKCAENFFESMKNEGIDIKFNKQMKNDDILEIIKNLK